MLNTDTLKKLLLLSLTIAMGFAFIQAGNLLAAPKSKKGKINSIAKEYRNLERRAKRLERKFGNLSSDQQASLLAKLADKYSDSDNDKLPDYLDTGSGRCNSDSDDDGILDGDEFGSSPSPSATPSSSASPSPSEGSLEVHALIQAISETAITLNNTTFTLNSNTEYLDDDNNPINRTDFSVGQCVEVEGFQSGGSNIAEKVKEEDDC